jgi:hypothetical protein
MVVAEGAVVVLEGLSMFMICAIGPHVKLPLARGLARLLSMSLSSDIVFISANRWNRIKLRRSVEMALLNWGAGKFGSKWGQENKIGY